jgi:hypothetical protein
VYLSSVSVMGLIVLLFPAATLRPLRTSEEGCRITRLRAFRPIYKENKALALSSRAQTAINIVATSARRPALKESTYAASGK